MDEDRDFPAAGISLLAPSPTAMVDSGQLGAQRGTPDPLQWVSGPPSRDSGGRSQAVDPEAAAGDLLSTVSGPLAVCGASLDGTRSAGARGGSEHSALRKMGPRLGMARSRDGQGVSHLPGAGRGSGRLSRPTEGSDVHLPPAGCAARTGGQHRRVSSVAVVTAVGVRETWEREIVGAAMGAREKGMLQTPPLYLPP